MSLEAAEEKRLGREAGPVVDREMFRKVVRQRQKMKAELRQLQEKVSVLPQDWEQRLPGWLESDRTEADEVAVTEEVLPEPDREPLAKPVVEAEDQKGLLESKDSLYPSGTRVTQAADGNGAPVGWEEKDRDYRRTIAELTLAGMIREAARDMGAYDPQDVVDLSRGFFAATYKDGAVSVEPGPALIGKGEAFCRPDIAEGFSLEGVVSAFLRTKPHLVRAGFRPGSGSIPGLGGSLSGQSPDGDDQARTRLTQRLRLQNRLG